MAAVSSPTLSTPRYFPIGDDCHGGETTRRQGKVEFYVRSGNTSSPQKNWSALGGALQESGGETVDCPPARFVQWKAVVVDADTGRCRMSPG